jgi:phage shock protein PspC (stress-responsive transcriptional regulator)
MVEHVTNKQLYRSEANRMIAGVAGGLGEYFEVDPTLIRLAFVLLTLSGGSGILIYIVLWIIIPTASSGRNAATHETMKANAKEVETKAKQFAKEAEHAAEGADTRMWLGAGVVILGVWLLLTNFGFLSAWFVGRLWPLILIIIGVVILGRSGRRGK